MKRKNDLSGRVFGRLTAIAIDKTSSPGRLKWSCVCSCGVSKSVLRDSLVSGRTESCGCLRKEEHSIRYKENLVGAVFSRLTVVSAAENRGEKTQWVCVCECGATKVATSSDLKSKKVVSCGCAKRENAATAAEAGRTRIPVGSKIGLLTVIRELNASPHPGRSGRLLHPYVCRCDCGREKTLDGSRLIAASVISCGCAKNSKLGLLPAWRRMSAAAGDAKRRARKLNAGGSFTATQVEDLRNKQRGRCANCGCKLTDRNMRRDHRKALANGGDNSILNIELLCDPCNGSKGAKDEIDWAQQNGRLL